MNKKHILVGLILLLLVAGIRGIMSLVPPDIVNALVVWYGDMETGDLSQWDRAQIVSSDRIRAVTAPVREGNYAMRVEVRQGDDPINASGNRNELVKFDGASEGTEFYYGWSTLWPSDYPLNPAWQVFMQWHHPGCCGAPPVRLVLGCSASDCGQPLPDTMFFIVDGQNIWTRTPVTRGVWHDFILHVKWSANPNVGFVELWYDGELVVPRRYVRTLYNSGDTNYLKMGLYRDESISQTAVMYHDGLIQGTTFADVEHFANGGSPTPVPTPQPGCHTATPGNWQNVAFAAAESGVFTAEADVTPTALGVAGAVSLSAAPAGHWGDLAVTVLFSDPVSEPGVPANSIVVRNGTAYAADATLIYEAGRTYHVRMEVDVPNHTYSVYVTPEGGSEVTLATDYAFRSTQQSVTELTTWTISAGEGAITACDLMAGDPGSQPELLAVAAVTASGDDGNGPQNTLDDDLSTRWSAWGDGEWIQYDLGSLATVSYLDVAFFVGDQRTATFDVQVSDDGSTWSTVLAGATSSGITNDLQTFDFADANGRYVRIVGHGNSNNLWNSYTEVDIYGFVGGTTPTPTPLPPPTPTSTPVPLCHTATPGNWQNEAFAAAENGVFMAEADVIPAALGAAGAISLAAAPASTWNDLAVTVLFSDPVSEPGVPANSILVRHGSGDTADTTLIYEAGRSYHIRMVVDVPNHTYSVYITPEGGSEVALASNYAFRSTQQSVTELTTWVVSSGIEATTACHFTIGPPPPAPEALTIVAVTASGDDGNGPQNTLDDDLSTRWSAFGDGEWIQYDLGNVVTVSYLDVAFFAGTQRVSYFDVQVSDDGSAWTTVFHDAAGSGMVDALQTFDFVDIHGRYVRIVGHGNTVNNWNSLTEVDVYGFADGTLPPPSPSRPVIFAVIGDYGEAGTDEEAVADLVKSWNPDFVITAGDNNYPDGEASTIDVNIGQYYHQFIHPYVGSYGSGASQNRFFPSLGNHDWHVYNAQPYIDYFALPGNEYYYEFSWNSLVHFFALDSQAAAQNGVGTQSQWLQPRLQRSREPWKIVYMHHPPYSSGNHGSSRFMQLPYESWGATAVMAGHDHTYERIFKGANNFPYFVNGLGGRSTYTCGSPVSGSQVCYDDNYGAMRVEATDTQITFQFITINGVVIDEYTLTH